MEKKLFNLFINFVNVKTGKHAYKRLKVEMVRNVTYLLGKTDQQIIKSFKFFLENLAAVIFGGVEENKTCEETKKQTQESNSFAIFENRV